MSEERAVEAARFIERERYIGSDFVRNARIVARAYLALSAPNPAVERPQDIVERLRKWGDGLPAGIFLMREAAAEIERLRAVERPADPMSVVQKAAMEWLDYCERETRTSAVLADPRGWQPMESAPKDGTLVLLYEDCIPASVQIGRWEEDGECWAADPGGWSVEVAMWQPLPLSPAPKDREGG